MDSPCSSTSPPAEREKQRPYVSLETEASTYSPTCVFSYTPINQLRKTATALTVVYFRSERETGGGSRLSSVRIQKDGGRVQEGRQQQQQQQRGSRGLSDGSRCPPGLKRALVAARESCILWKITVLCPH
ncbi:hypothetical protein Q8A73_015722 [Channa argus]|nr:hypothetical protein Q8A73_015722 [Channa argus]